MVRPFSYHFKPTDIKDLGLMVKISAEYPSAFLTGWAVIILWQIV